MKYPRELYARSPRPYHGLSELKYPLHDRTVTVTTCGRICVGRRKFNLSGVFAGQNVGVKEVGDKIWLVRFRNTIQACSTKRLARTLAPKTTATLTG